MGNGSSHGKDAKRYDQPPKGARVVGESGKAEIYKGEGSIAGKPPKQKKVKSKKKA
jgi:hypothetical protein